jgi:pimeloyl-ACP methyl ester carboxylesterase
MDRPGERWEGFVSADDGTRLYARERRGAPGLTALLCDGIACDGFIWRYLLDDLLAISSVLHWNYRGHGRSSAPVDEERIDIQAFVDDLEAVRRSRLREPAILFGHSMGCQLVLEGYRRRPQGIVAMVLICGAPGRMTHSFKGSDALARALPGVIERVRRHPHLARALWSNVPPHVAARLALAAGEVDRSTIEPEDLVRYSEHVAGLDLLMFLRMLHACGEASAEDMLAEVSVPTLVIAGASDSFTPPRLAEAMAAQLPDSELLMVPGATHVVPIERREEVRERIFAFVRERVLLQR